MERAVKKRETVKSMVEGSPARMLLLFALPLMAGNIFQQLYTVTDTAIVGRALGVQALAALGTVDWLNWLVLGVIQGITQGFSIQIAQWFGAQEYAKMRKTIGNSAVLSAAGAVILLAAAQLLVGPAVAFLQVPEEIVPISSNYLRVIFCGIPVMMAFNLCSSILRALGDSRTPLTAMVVASVTNIALDLLFVIGFGWGVAGAAGATVAAQVLSVVYCVWKMRGIGLLRMERGDFAAERTLCRRLLGLGAPVAFQNAIIAVGGMIVQVVVNGFGVIFIAGFTATNKLYGILEVAATSYGYAMTTYAGQNMGAGNYKRISQGIRAGLLISLVTSVMISSCMLLFGREILGIFISGDAATEGRALAVGYRYLSIMSICLPVLYLLHITRSCIQGMGNTVIPMMSGIAEFVMRTGASLLLPLILGENGILFAEIIAWAGADLILVPGYLYVRRKLGISGQI